MKLISKARLLIKARKIREDLQWVNGCIKYTHSVKFYNAIGQEIKSSPLVYEDRNGKTLSWKDVQKRKELNIYNLREILKTIRILES